MSENEIKSDGWLVRKAASLLKPGERFIFTEDMGGENEVVTVVSTGDAFGTLAIETEELDFDLDVTTNQMLTMALPEDDDD